MQTQHRGASIGRGEGTLPQGRAVLFALAAMAVVAASLPALSESTAFDYAPGRCVIKAGVLNLELAGGGLQGNPNLGTNLITDPGIMEGLRRASFRPPRWDFVNPQGTTRDLAGAYVPEGSPLYWQVVLRANERTDLSGYDLLYLCSTDLTVLTSFQVDSLLAAVNQGAVLWIDSANPTNTAAGAPCPWNTSPLFFGFTADTLSVTSLVVTNHALVTRPFRMAAAQMTQIGIAGDTDRLDVSANLRHMFPLLGSGNYTVAAAGRYGGGGFVVTGGDVGAEIAGWAAGGLPDPLAPQAADVMFACNIAAWATGWTQSRQSRGTRASIGELWADLDVKWQRAVTEPVVSSPVIDEVGREFLVSYGVSRNLQPRLYCFDSDPAQDIDGDGNADDGIADYAGPGSADLIWAVDLPGSPRSASAAVATAAIGSGTDVVLVSLWYTDTGRDRVRVVCYRGADGTGVWSADLTPFRAQADDVSISTPVVHDGYVYVLVSELDSTGPGGNATYGRVFCFDLATGGNATNGFWWMYPDPSLAPPPGSARDQYQMALPPLDDPAWVAAANRGELPPVPTPTPSVGSAPQYPGTIPEAPATFDPHLDAVAYFGTPASRGWNGTVPTTLAGLGSDFALVPTPCNPLASPPEPSPDPFAANRRHYRIRFLSHPPNPPWDPLPPLPPLPDAAAAPPAISNVWTYYDPGLTGSTAPIGPAAAAMDPAAVNGFFEYPYYEVQRWLASLPDLGAPSYYSVQTGCPALLLVNYTHQDYAGTPPSLQWFRDDLNLKAVLPGPVLYERRYPAGGARVSGQSVGKDVLAGARSGGGVIGLDPATGEKRWAYDPTTAASPGDAAGASVETAPADAKTAVVSSASVPIAANEGYRSHTFALDPRPDVTVTLRINPPLVGTVSVSLATGAGGTPLLDPTCYQVDFANSRMTFPSAIADNVTSGGVGVGAVYGRMLIVTYAPAGGPAATGVYSAPDLARWEYVPGWSYNSASNWTIRLRHHPVLLSSVAATLPNGMAVAGLVAGEATVTVSGQVWLPTGLINCAAATYAASGAPVQRGAELLFAYGGMTPDGPVTVPNAYEPLERHQIPWLTGRSLAPPVTANDGQTVLLGTESFDLGATGALTASPFAGGYWLDYSTTPPTPRAMADPRRTMLGLAWDKVTNAVRGVLVKPVYEPPSASGAPPRVPIVSGAPAVSGDTAFVSTRVLNTLPNTTDPNTLPYGYEGTPVASYASALSPMRTVIADDQRIVETVGSRVDWVCSGPRVLDSAWYNDDARANARWPEGDPTANPPVAPAPEARLPFSRPAKAARLTHEDFLARLGWTVPRWARPAGGNYALVDAGLGAGDTLVVDTGNNRVVEIDRKGRQAWPLASYQPNVNNPPPPGTRRSTDHLGFDYHTSPANTNLSLNHPTDAYRYWMLVNNVWEMHTVIADSGNCRVVDVVTTFGFVEQNDITYVTQTHVVSVVTPPHIATPASTRPGERVRVAYTKAVPLINPASGLVDGYLCAASNLNELVVIAANAARTVDPPAGDALPGGGGTWSMWSWLYANDADASAATDDRLIFENIRDVQVSLQPDVNGVPYLFVAVVCGRYRGPLANPYAINVPANGRAAGPVCLEFRLGDLVAGFDRSTPATWTLCPAAGGWWVPYWYYTDRDYQAGPLGRLFRPGQTTVDTKTFAPVSSQRLSYGRHLIANYKGFVENLTHPNLGTATDYGTPPSLGSDVFEVETQYTTPNDPATQRHIIDVHRAIPDPWDDEWADPINQPSYAQRVQDSGGPVVP